MLSNQASNIDNLVYTFLLFLLLFSALLYVLQTLLVYSGTHRLQYSKSEKLPGISILVALRNEEQTLQSCVHSLLVLDYPKDKLEILLINDRSTDATARLINKIAQENTSIKALHISQGIAGMSGKANAIAQGMASANNEIVLVTDGDCQVPPAWARTHAAYYTDDVGLVGGFTLLDRKKDGAPVFSKIQSLDWAYLLSIGTGAMGFGQPLSVLGNNFSFRKAAYNEVGGYLNMGFTIIEDFALMKTLVKKTQWKVRYPIDENMLVYSNPMPDLRRFYHQRKRWAAGGKEVGIYGKFLMATSWLVHLLLCTFPFINTGSPFLLAFAAVVLADFFLLFRTTGLVSRRDLLLRFPLWEVFYIMYTAFFAPVLLFPTTIRWKDTSYSWKLNWQIKQVVE